MNTDAKRYREMAARKRAQSRESFERCDTDGFLSQWAADITARKYDLMAEIADAGGMAQFIGLYAGDRRVAARIIETTAFNRPWAKSHVWILRDDESAAFGRKFIPVGNRSRVQRDLGLRERPEMAPATADIAGDGRGLGGCATARVIAVRTGDPWGSDAVLVVG